MSKDTKYSHNHPVPRKELVDEQYESKDIYPDDEVKLERFSPNAQNHSGQFTIYTHVKHNYKS
ncbi:TPA: hypothetical protein O1M59_001651 [Klebsiella variicola]|nr:hypothetical protein [Klebsiella variicola]